MESNFNKALFHDIFPEIHKIDLRESEVSDEYFNEFFTSALVSNLSDTRNRNEYSTPLEVIEIVSALCGFSKCRVVYNPFAGQCSLAVGVIKGNFSNCKFYGEEINRETYLRGLINLTIHKINTSGFINADSFSQVHENRADLCILNPPFMSFMPPSSRLNASNDIMNTRSSVFHAVQLSIDSLNPVGRAIILVAENFLFSNNNEHAAFRKKLIGENLIESVISLPAGINKPFSSVKSNLLVLNKSKSSKSTIFFDYEKFERIIAHESKSDKTTIEEFISFYSNITENISRPELGLMDQIFVNILELEKGAHNLVVSRYLREKGEELDDRTIRKIGDVLKFVNTSRVSSTSEQKLINISDLNRNYFEYKIDLSKIETKKGIINGRLISENSILVGSIVGSFKPSYFEYDDIPIAINPNVLTPYKAGRIININLVAEEIGKNDKNKKTIFPGGEV